MNITAPMLARVLGVSEATIRNHIRRGLLPASRPSGIHGPWRIKRPDADAYARCFGKRLPNNRQTSQPLSVNPSQRSR